MRVLRIGYLGVRTTHPEAMTGFFRDVLGFEAAGERGTVTFQRLPTHHCKRPGPLRGSRWVVLECATGSRHNTDVCGRYRRVTVQAGRQ